MSDPPSWPENTQTVCVVSDADSALVHRSIKCPLLIHGRLTFSTTGLARTAGKTPCPCLVLTSEEPS
jgi:hypothetical protein